MTEDKLTVAQLQARPLRAIAFRATDGSQDLAPDDAELLPSVIYIQYL